MWLQDHVWEMFRDSTHSQLDPVNLRLVFEIEFAVARWEKSDFHFEFQRWVYSKTWTVFETNPSDPLLREGVLKQLSILHPWWGWLFRWTILPHIVVGATSKPESAKPDSDAIPLWREHWAKTNFTVQADRSKLEDGARAIKLASCRRQGYSA